MPAMTFSTPTSRVAGVAYCANSHQAVIRKRHQWMSTEQGLDLIATLHELFGETETRMDGGAMVVVAGSGDLWYVVGVRADDAVSLQTRCGCHAREIAGQLFELRDTPDAPAPVSDEDDGAACGLCGEASDHEMGEFVVTPGGDHVIAHAQCGADKGYELA